MTTLDVWIKMKQIFILGNNEREAKDYIDTHIKVVTTALQLRGYNPGTVLVVLPKPRDIIDDAKGRGFEIVHV